MEASLTTLCKKQFSVTPYPLLAAVFLTTNVIFGMCLFIDVSSASTSIHSGSTSR